MLPNLATIAKNLPTFFGNIFMSNLSFF